MRWLSSWLSVGTFGLGSSVLAAGVAGTLLPKGTVPVLDAVFRQETPPPAPAVPEGTPPTGAPAVPEGAPAPMADAISDQSRTHRIRLSSDGLVPGKILVVDPQTNAVVPATDLTVMFAQNGEIKAQVEPGEGGVFQASGLGPGLYSVIASGASGFVAFGVELLPAAVAHVPRDGVVQPVSFFQEEQAALEIDALAVPPRDLEAVGQLVRSYVPAAGASVGGIDDADVLSAAPPAVGQDGKPLSDRPTTSIKQHSVMLGENGSLSGRMRRLHPQTGKPMRMRRLNVFLVQGDQVAGQARVDSVSGEFKFTGIQPGDYSVVAAGPEGFAAFAVQIVSFDAATITQTPRELVMPVSFAQLPPGEAAALAKLNQIVTVLVQNADTQLAAQQLQQAIQQALQQSLANAANPPAPNAPGAPGGSGGGGLGGGPGGGGPLGTLLGLAAGGALGAAIADAANDDGPSSP